MSPARRRARLAVAALVAALLALLLARALLDGAAPAAPARPVAGPLPPPRAPAAAPAASETPAATVEGGEAPVASGAAAGRWTGLLTRDGAPWPGGIVRLEEVDAACRPTGRAVEATAGAGGRFELAPLPSGWWSVVPAPGWAPGATAAAEVVAPDELAEETAPSLTSGPLAVALRAPPAAGDFHGHALDLPEDEGPWLLLVDARGPRRVAGRVIDAGGAPAAGVDVWLVEDADDGRPEALRIAASGPDGTFAWDAPAWLDEDVRLLARRAGRAPGVATLGRRALAVTLRLGRELLLLEGVARDLDRRPVVGAEVTVSASLPDETNGGSASGWSERTTTGADGRFRLEVPAGAGRYWPAGPRAARVVVEARHPDRCPARVEAWLPSAAPVELVLPGEAPLAGRIVGPDGAPLAEQLVTGSVPSRPVAGAVVARTGPDGRFAFEEASEALIVTLRVPPEELTPRRVLVTSGPVELRLGPGAQVGGVVRDARGRPAAGVLVRASAGYHTDLDAEARRALARVRRGEQLELTGQQRVSARTDAEGRFLLGALPPGQDVALSIEDREQRTVRAGALDVELRLPLGKRDLVRRGRVVPVAAESGAPLEAWLVVETAAGACAEGPDGLRLPATAGLVRVGARGRMPVELPFDEGEADLDLGEARLARGGSLELLARWPARPLLRLFVRRRGPDGRGDEDEAEPVARAEAPWLQADGLAPGEHRVEVVAEADDGARLIAAPFTVTVRAGETTRAEVDLEAAREERR